MSDKQAFWRQSFILLTRCVGAVSAGAFFAHAPILEASIASGNDVVVATPEQVSWIVSCFGIGGVFGVCLDTFLWEYCGRRSVHLNTNFMSLISWATFYFANSVSTLVAASLIEGLAIGGLFSMPSMMTSEYSSPSRRGYFIVINEVVLFLSLLAFHLISLVFNRQQIALLGAAPNVFSFLCTLFWPESPYYLALKGNLEKCKKSYVWLNGDLSHNDRELQEMIAIQSRNKMIPKKSLKDKLSIKNIKSNFTREFMKALLIVLILVIVLDSSGRIFFGVYCYKIMRKLFSSRPVAVYCTVGINSLQVLSLFIIGIAIRFFNRRTILFTTGISSIIVMYLMGIICVLKPFIASDNLFSIFIVTCLFLQSFLINIGVVPVTLALISEVFPLKSKSLGSFLSGLFFSFIITVNSKVSPILMESISIGGLYSVFATVLVICFLVLYKILPETKDKPLLAIEKEIQVNEDIITIELKPMLKVEK